MATLVYRVSILGLSSMAVIGQTVQLDSVLRNASLAASGMAVHPAYASVVTMDGVLTVVMAALAVVLAFHPGGERGARPLGLTVAVWGYLLAYSGLIALLRPEQSGTVGALLFQTHFLIVEMVGLAALLRFSALFPRTLAPSDLADPKVLAPALALFQRFRRWLLAAPSPWIAAGLTTGVALAVNGLLGNPPSEAALLVLVDVVRFAALSLVVLNLRRSYLLAQAGERESARWLGVGFALLVGSLAVLMGGNVLSAVTGWRVPFLSWRPLILDLGLMGFVLGGAMGTFYRGRVRSGRVGRTVVVLSLLALSILLLGSGLEALFSDALFARLDLPRGVGTALAALFVTVVYLRFRRPLGQALEASVRGSMGGPPPDGWARTG